jgi:Tol biopolymer transport system component
MHNARRLAAAAVVSLAVSLSLSAPPGRAAMPASTSAVTSAVTSAWPRATGVRNGRIAFSTGFIQPDPDLSGHSQVFTVNPDGTDLHQLTHVPKGSAAGDPDWSPNGRRIAYVSNTAGNFALFVMNADGAHKHRVAYTNGWDYFQPRWSPDGRLFVVTRCNQSFNYCDLDVLRTNGTGRRTLVGGHVTNQYPDWSPSGRLIAFTSNRAGLLSAIWVVRRSGDGLRRLTAPVIEASYPQWSPSGDRLLFGNNADRPHTNTFELNLSNGHTRQLTQVPYGFDAGFATYSPDGLRIAFVTDHQDSFVLSTMNADGTDVTHLHTRPQFTTYSDWGIHPLSVAAATR